MSITQRFFLHTPAWNREAIERYVSQHITEGEQLDFKSPPGWNEGTDASKDVVAFANHLGGDIIIGIDEDGSDCAKDWNPIPNHEIAGIEEKAMNWLKAHLYPREFVQTVRMERVPANKADHSVLVVSIPPYPDLVGIEKTGNRKGEIDFRFPIRAGNSTRWLIFEEIMKRFASSTRSVYIRLKMFEANPDKDFPIRFSSPVLMTSPIGAGGTIGTKPAPGEDGIHCRFDALSEDTITVKMRALPSVSIATDYKLAIPLEFIRAVWEEPKNPGRVPRLFLALDAEIVWNGSNAWHLITNTVR
jgi:hypothetical protein